MAYVKHRGYATALRPRFPGASAYADQRLRLRLVEWKRARFRTRWKFKDRVYERPRPQLVPLDYLDRLDAALAARSGDPADSGDSALGGLLDDGDRQRAARDLDTLGLGPP